MREVEDSRLRNIDHSRTARAFASVSVENRDAPVCRANSHCEVRKCVFSNGLPLSTGIRTGVITVSKRVRATAREKCRADVPNCAHAQLRLIASRMAATCQVPDIQVYARGKKNWIKYNRMCSARAPQNKTHPVKEFTKCQ